MSELIPGHWFEVAVRVNTLLAAAVILGGCPADKDTVTPVDTDTVDTTIEEEDDNGDLVNATALSIDLDATDPNVPVELFDAPDAIAPPGDRDFFTIALNAGTPYHFWVDTGRNLLCDTVLRIYEPGASVMAEPGNPGDASAESDEMLYRWGGSDPGMVYVPRFDGRHTVEIIEYSDSIGEPAAGGDECTYMLKAMRRQVREQECNDEVSVRDFLEAADTASDEYPDDLISPAVQQMVESNFQTYAEEFSGSIDFDSDDDVWRFRFGDLPAEEGAHFWLFSLWPTMPDTTEFPQRQYALTLYDSQFEILAQTQEAVPDGRYGFVEDAGIVYPVSSFSTYYLQVTQREEPEPTPVDTDTGDTDDSDTDSEDTDVEDTDVDTEDTDVDTETAPPIETDQPTDTGDSDVDSDVDSADTDDTDLPTDTGDTDNGGLLPDTSDSSTDSSSGETDTDTVVDTDSDTDAVLDTDTDTALPDSDTTPDSDSDTPDSDSDTPDSDSDTPDTDSSVDSDTDGVVSMAAFPSPFGYGWQPGTPGVGQPSYYLGSAHGYGNALVDCENPPVPDDPLRPRWREHEDNSDISLNNNNDFNEAQNLLFCKVGETDLYVARVWGQFAPTGAAESFTPSNGDELNPDPHSDCGGPLRCPDREMFVLNRSSQSGGAIGGRRLTLSLQTRSVGSFAAPEIFLFKNNEQLESIRSSYDPSEHDASLELGGSDVVMQYDLPNDITELFILIQPVLFHEERAEANTWFLRAFMEEIPDANTGG